MLLSEFCLDRFKQLVEPVAEAPLLGLANKGEGVVAQTPQTSSSKIVEKGECFFFPLSPFLGLENILTSKNSNFDGVFRVPYAVLNASVIYLPGERGETYQE